MKKLFTILLLLTYGICEGQNLVPNNSFEVLDSCNRLIGGIWAEYAHPWNSPNTGTADLFNSCSTNTTTMMPNNWAGYQYPHSGNGYAGGCFWGDVYKEYLQIELDSIMTYQEHYCISFYVNLASKALWAHNNIGLYISDTMVHDTTSNLLNFTPQINDTNIVSDTTNWTLIYGQYIAHGGERYIIIGNFFSDAVTDSIQFHTGAFVPAYYYIDDVNVHCCSCDSVNHSGINELAKEEITIYPNPIIDELNVQANNYDPTEITLYDLSSRKLLQQTFTNTTTLNTEQLAKGMYFYEVRCFDKLSRTNRIIKNGKLIKE